MRNALQYVYSISVFMGVIVTAYLSLQKEGNARIPLRAIQSPNFRVEAGLADASVGKLQEVEEVLAEIKLQLRSDEAKRTGASIASPDRELPTEP